MDLINIICAFFGGIMSAGIGGYQMFVFCAMLCLITALTGLPISNVAFGPFFNPCTTVVACAVSVAYANKKQYGKVDHIVTEQLVKVEHIDVLLIGGVAGCIGWIIYSLLASVAFPGWDCVATTVVIVPLAYKIIISGSPCGPVTEEVIKLGGRFSIFNGKAAIPGLRRGIDRIIWPGAYGAALALSMVTLVNNGVNPGCAFLLGFGVGGTLLLFPTVFMTHYIGCTVCTAILYVAEANGGINWYATEAAVSIAVLWGVAIGILAMFAFNYMSDLFWMHGFYVHIDGPSMAIMVLTIPGSIVAKFIPQFYSSITAPFIIIVLCIIWGMLIDNKYKRYKVLVAEAQPI
jgi:hypothetical protein